MWCTFDCENCPDYEDCHKELKNKEIPRYQELLTSFKEL